MDDRAGRCRGRRRSEPRSGGIAWSYGYDRAGRQIASSDGRPLLTDLGNTYGAVVSYRYEDGTKRLAGISLDREQISGTELDLSYTYDRAGNVTSLSDVPTRSTLQDAAFGDNQCFGYDGLARLDLAWTAENGVCDQAPSAGAVGGAAPYWTSYAYDVLGNRTGRTAHAADGSPTSTVYTHGAGSAGPHAVTKAVTGGTATVYGYDDAGNRVSAASGSQASEYGWDAEGELVSAGDAGFVYDADGNRLVREDAGGTTVYLGGQEVLIKPGGAVSVTRYYSFAGKTVAVRTGRGLGDAVTSLVADHHGTPVAAVPNTGHPVRTPVARLYTDPFGGRRGVSGAGTVPGDVQFLGKVRDESSGLTLLGARYYDEVVGGFVSVDPILDLMDPQQWNGYAYAVSNPVTLSDPTGLTPKFRIDKGGSSSAGKGASAGTAGNGGGKASSSAARPVASSSSGGSAAAEEWWNPFSWSGQTWQNVGATVGGVLVGVVIAAAVVVCVAATAGICAAAGAGVLLGGLAVAGAAGSVSSYHWSAGEKSAGGYASSAIVGGGLGAIGGAAGALAAKGALSVSSGAGGSSAAAKTVPEAASATSKIYSNRVLQRMADEPGALHNFPSSFDDVVFSQGTRTANSNYFNAAKPGLGNDSIQYRLPGVVNGKSGVYEIFTRPSLSGESELIMHRFFRPEH